MSDYYADNLAIVKENHPQLFSQLTSYGNQIDCEIAEINQHHDVGIFVNDAQGRRIFHEEKGYYREVMIAQINHHLSLMEKHGCALVFFGLDAGQRLMYAFNSSDNLSNFFVIERHPEFMKAIMRYFDMRRILSSNRVFFFLGEDAAEQLIKFLEKEYVMKLPADGLIFSALEDRQFYDSSRITVFSSIKEKLVSFRNHVQNIGSCYRDLSVDQMRVVFSGASGRPVRVIGDLSKQTSFMQHAMRSCIGGFNKAGCSTLLMESESGLISSYYFHENLNNFRPDLFFKINHFSREVYDIPNLVTATWIQDFMPFIFNPQMPAEEKIGPHDQIFVMVRIYTDDLIKLGFEKRKIRQLFFGSDPDLYYPLNLGREDIERYGCDINFICNYPDYTSVYSVLSKEAVEHLFTVMSTRDAYGLEDFKEIYKSAERELGGIILNQAACRRARETCPGITDEQVVVLFVWTALASAALRLPYLATITDKKLFIYGSGWDQDLRFKPFARGRASYGQEICKISNAGKINVNFHVVSNNHSRIFDTIAAGGFMLTKLTPEDNGPGSIGDLFEIGKEIEVFKDKKEFKDKVEYYLAHDKERKAIAYRGYQRFLKEHTMKHRMQQVLDVVREGLEQDGSASYNE